MHHGNDDVHWLLYMLGMVLERLESHASLVVFVVGIVMQVMNYRLRRREVALKELESKARLDGKL